MKRKEGSVSPPPANRATEERPLPERREFERVDLPATAFVLDGQGNEMGRVVEISGGGLLLDPSSPWARLSLVTGQRLIATVVEPASGNRTAMNVEVRHITSHSIGLRFL